MAQEEQNKNSLQKVAAPQVERQRPPIVVVMGHIDHGKTTLLDYIRKTNIAAREAGGITQAVGAYEILHNGKKVTFIDTPGHEAFLSMRSRGAEVADLAILVVAADEGVKPQTKEAVEILNAAKTPFIVAINKIDKTKGDVEKAKNELTAAGILLEGYGGRISWHGISAKTGEGVQELLDLVILAAELENLKFDPSAPAAGYVLEVRRDSRRGVEATLIIKNGILRRGDRIYTPSASGRVKILENFLGEAVQSLEPSAPAVVVGFEGEVRAGENFSVSPIEIAPKKKEIAKAVVGQETGKAVLNLIVKSEDAGSLEALVSVIGAMATPEKAINFIDESVGNITDNDVKNAIATGAFIIGFKSKVDKGARNLAESNKVKIIVSDVIYDLTKSVEDFFLNFGKALTVGELEVLAVFNQKKIEKQLVGGRVLSGVIRNKASFEIVRREKKEGIGRILNLREKKSDTSQAEAGKEVGLLVKAQVLIEVGDRLVVRE